jgi:hypothetical protein
LLKYFFRSPAISIAGADEVAIGRLILFVLREVSAAAVARVAIRP